MAHPGNFAVKQIDAIGAEVAGLRESLQPQEEEGTADPLSRLAVQAQLATATALLAVAKELKDLREALSAGAR